MFRGKNLLHNKQCAAQYIIAIQKPVSLPLFTPLPPNCITQPLQNLHVEMTSNTSSSGYKLMVHQTVDIKEFQQLPACPS
jgi:hypothetical protein